MSLSPRLLSAADPPSRISARRSFPGLWDCTGASIKGIVSYEASLKWTTHGYARTWCLSPCRSGHSCCDEEVDEEPLPKRDSTSGAIFNVFQACGVRKHWIFVPCLFILKVYRSNCSQSSPGKLPNATD